MALEGKEGGALSLCDVLGVPLSEVPVCLLETWDSTPPMEPNEARTARLGSGRRKNRPSLWGHPGDG